MKTVIEFLQGIFAEDVIDDDRTPLFTLDIPTIVVDEGLQFAVYAPNPEGWKQLAVLVVLQSVVQMVFGVIVYMSIVKQRGTMQAYLVGWGIILPIALYLPFYFLDLFNIRNKVVTLSSTTVMTVIFFRCIEAMYGTSPNSGVMESSLWNYCGYYSSVAPFVWDPKTKQRKYITTSQLWSSLLDLTIHFVVVSLVLSALIHFQYRPFKDPIQLTELSISKELISKEHLLNSYCHAVLTYLTLKTGFDLTAFAENIKGYATDTIFDSPLTNSRSPTEFWTKRWNLMIQRFLKGGVFLPAKKYVNAKLAMFLTFVVSGLYHEYVWLAIFYNQKYLYDENGGCTKQECYLNEFGRVTAFFTYVGIIMAVERPFGNIPGVQWLTKRLPTPVISHFLILLHLPVAQWYIGDWIEGGYFDDFSICTFLVKRI